MTFTAKFFVLAILLFILSNAQLSTKTYGNNEGFQTNDRFLNMSFSITSVEKIQHEHDKEINEMKNEIEMLKNLVYRLIADKSCDKKQDVAIDNINKKVEAFRMEMLDSIKKNGQRINDVLLEHQNSSNKMLTELHSNSHSKRAGGSNSVTQIAFHTSLSDKLLLIQQNEVLIFDTVNLNIGNHYDTVSGKFTASVAGVYVFFATIVSDIATVFRSVIKHNNQDKAYVHSPLINNDYGSASNMAIISLQKNDEVWIEAVDGGDGIDDWSDFGGFLLYPELHWQTVG